MQIVSVGVDYFLPTLISYYGNDHWGIGKRGPDQTFARKAVSYGVNIVKIGTVHLGDIQLDMPIFAM